MTLEAFPWRGRQMSAVKRLIDKSLQLPRILSIWLSGAGSEQLSTSLPMTVRHLTRSEQLITMLNHLGNGYDASWIEEVAAATTLWRTLLKAHAAQPCTDDEDRLNIKAAGIWEDGCEEAFFDVRVFNPFAAS